MKLAVTGAGGGLGRAFQAAVRDNHELHSFTHQDLDVCSFDAVKETLVGLEPDVIMHFAAMTAVDGCETDPQRAADTNIVGSFNVAAAAQETGALLVAMSSDYVFDGEKSDPYDERDLPNPISMYGRTKYAGEKAAEAVATSDNCMIVRTSWVFGAGEDYASKAIRKLADGGEAGGLMDQVGSPTHVDLLAERLVPLIESGLRGLVHVAGPEAVSWYEVFVRAKKLGDLTGEVVAQKADELDRPALRPANSALVSVVLPDSDVPRMPPLDEGIRRVLSDVGVL